MVRSLSSAVDPSSLPRVWRGNDLAAEQKTVASGHALLDEALPGRGWPQGSMVEVLQHRAGQHVWQLLLPGLVRALEQFDGPVVLVGSPFQPFGPGLQARGFPAERILRVQAEPQAARLWAAEQALRCAQVAAVLAWLPEARSDELRRLHLASQQHSRLLFVFRFARSRHEASPAALRLLVEGCDVLEVRLLKRRGPPLLRTLVLPAHPSKLAALLQARRHGRQPTVESIPVSGRSDVLDRSAAWA
jgi:protein ImuA